MANVWLVDGHCNQVGLRPSLEDFTNAIKPARESSHHDRVNATLQLRPMNSVGSNGHSPAQCLSRQMNIQLTVSPLQNVSSW